jgi:amidase
MVSLAEYAALDATGLAEAIRAGGIGRAEVGEVAGQALALADRTLNPFAEGPWRSPLEHAPDGPFGGVPFVIKDLACHAAGVPQHAGSRALARGVVKEHDSELMARFRRAGLALRGTTRTPEFALNATTEPLLGGPVRNPWDPTRSPGGSSGGSAALVAAGAVPVAHANDGAGSIRIPAAYTGTVGLKPSRGRVPIGPDLADPFSGNVVEFAVTRTVRDTARLLDAVHGPMPGERFHAPPPARRYVEELDGPPGPLRVAVCASSWADLPLHPDVTRALESTATLLESLGHHVEPVAPFVDWEQFIESLTITWCAGVAGDVLPLAEALGIEVDREHFEATTVAAARAGMELTPVDLARSSALNNALSRRMAAFMADHDVLVTIATSTPAVPLGTFDADDAELSAAEWVRHLLTAHPVCGLYNISGAPAISLPAGLSAEGLPVGLQFGADLFREDLLIGLAAQLEQARPWSGWRPRLHVGQGVAV